MMNNLKIMISKVLSFFEEDNYIALGKMFLKRPFGHGFRKLLFIMLTCCQMQKRAC